MVETVMRSLRCLFWSFFGEFRGKKIFQIFSFGKPGNQWRTEFQRWVMKYRFIFDWMKTVKTRCLTMWKVYIFIFLLKCFLLFFSLLRISEKTELSDDNISKMFCWRKLLLSYFLVAFKHLVSKYNSRKEKSHKAICYGLGNWSFGKMVFKLRFVERIPFQASSGHG